MINARMARLFLLFAVACQGNTASQYELPADGHEAEAEAESEGVVICEEQDYTEDERNAAFVTARQALAEQGYTVAPITLEDEEGFTLLVEQMIVALGCVPEGDDGSVTQRRYGSATCETVTEVPEDEPATGVFYCGEEARRGMGCSRLRRLVGDCLNLVCWAHDLCYENLVAESGPICIWSNDTENCDAEFHLGTARCVARLQCGFWCMLTMTAAANIDLLQEAGKLEGYECLYGRCLEGRADCDGNRDNGCEVFLATDAENCGRCGRSCDDGDPCTDDQCVGNDCVHNPLSCSCVDCWRSISTDSSPGSRSNHTAIWTGSEMIVWGGWNDGLYTNTGGRYNPATDTWSTISTTGAPEACDDHTAIWTGSEMIVWGGNSSGLTNTGGRYNPATDTWSTMSITGAPSRRDRHTAIWTGSEMIVWGGNGGGGVGRLNTGGRYDPATDTWSVTSTSGLLPSQRDRHTAIWTGDEMVVWGGKRYGLNPYTNTGGHYNLVINAWLTTSTTNMPGGRASHTAIWTGEEMVVWGGEYYSDLLNTGGRYNPDTDTWSAWSTMSTTGAPEARSEHTAIWTGLEMIVWGGWNDGIYTNTGGRYNPATDTWSTMSTTGAPEARDEHTAIWTGSEMIVWGGEIADGITNTGARYTPP